jgi:hypothetical protein
VKHDHVSDTLDGGLAPFITVAEKDTEVPQQVGSDISDTAGESPRSSNRGTSLETWLDEKLEAFCHCGTVRFYITRPDGSSRNPHSGFPDLMIPFKSGAPEIKNAGDQKWWLRPEDSTAPTHYMAGTCACKSCRLISGFEIQAWAFVPRSNIIFHIPATMNPAADTSGSDDHLVPLDFSALPANILRTYESSPGVLRESCVNCGATVFWHDKWRPELIDVSVGLLDAPEGSRAESWLEWWRQRVSFLEDAGNGRFGTVATKAIALIEGLELGLRASGGH